VQEQDPKERIYLAALNLFGQNGFKGTTIRDICKEADVSLALVNYHFRNKKNLYKEIIQKTIGEAFNQNPVTMYVNEDMEPEDKLRNMIRLLSHRLLGEKGVGKNPSAVTLLAKELIDPSEAMEDIYNEHLAAIIELFISTLKDIMGDIPQKELVRFASSIVGQITHPLIAKNFLKRSGFEIKHENSEIEQHAKHIFIFSMNGIKGYKRGTK